MCDCHSLLTMCTEQRDHSVSVVQATLSCLGEAIPVAASTAQAAAQAVGQLLEHPVVLHLLHHPPTPQVHPQGFHHTVYPECAKNQRPVLLLMLCRQFLIYCLCSFLMLSPKCLPLRLTPLPLQTYSAAIAKYCTQFSLPVLPPGVHPSFHPRNA